MQATSTIAIEMQSLESPPHINLHTTPSHSVLVSVPPSHSTYRPPLPTQLLPPIFRSTCSIKHLALFTPIMHAPQIRTYVVLPVRLARALVAPPPLPRPVGDAVTPVLVRCIFGYCRAWLRRLAVVIGGECAVGYVGFFVMLWGG